MWVPPGRTKAAPCVNLFASSTAQDATAWEYLARFAEKSRNNPNGWGIGFFATAGAGFVGRASTPGPGARRFPAPGPGSGQPPHHLPDLRPTGGPAQGIPWSRPGAISFSIITGSSVSAATPGSPTTKVPGPSCRMCAHQLRSGSWNSSGTAWRPRCKSGLTRTFTRPWR